MRRLVIDSGVYIDWLNARRHEDILFGRGNVKYLSAIVLMELRAGAFSTGIDVSFSAWRRRFCERGVS